MPLNRPRDVKMAPVTIAALPPIPLAEDVVAYIRDVFEQADRHASSRLTTMPTSHEEWLDFALIDAVSTARGPHRTTSGTVVDVQIHFVGSGWHHERWEIADIGFIINFRTPTEILRTKVALLQSKRIYPIEQEFTEMHGTVYENGFMSLMRPTPQVLEDRSFRVEGNSRYKALQIGDPQWSRIIEFEDRHHLPVYYCLYHPLKVPSTATIPAIAEIAPENEDPQVGVRIIAAKALRALVSALPYGHTPSYDQVRSGTGVPGTSLSDFVAEKLLGCTEGYVVEGDEWESNDGLRAVFNRRTGPIAAAIRIDIVFPQQA